LPLLLEGAAASQPELATALEQGPNVYRVKQRRGKSSKRVGRISFTIGAQELKDYVDENGSFIVPRQIVRLSPQFKLSRSGASMKLATVAKQIVDALPQCMLTVQELYASLDFRGPGNRHLAIPDRKGKRDKPCAPRRERNQ